MFRTTVLSSWLLLGAVAIAQNSVPPQPALPSATMNSGVMVTGGLEFPNADVKAVLSYYEQLTGKRLIYDNSVAGPVNIVVKTALTKEEAVRIIEMSLLLNGYSLVPAGGDLIKVLGLGKNPRGYGIPIISDDLQLPESEQIVTFVYKLRYADPTEVQQLLSQYTQGTTNSQYSQVLALPKSQSLLITENTTIIRGLLKVIRELDIPPVEVESEFIRLERADAKTVTENILKIINPQQTGTGGTGAANGARNVSAGAARPVPQPRVSPEGNPIPGDIVATPASNGSVEITSSTTLTEDAIIKAVLTPDERTNRIHVVARPSNMPFLRKLIREFDMDVPFGVPATRPLQHRPADEILPVIVKAISDPGAKAEESGAGTTGTGTSTNRQGSGTFGSRGNDDLFGGSSSGMGGSSVASNVNDSLETQPRETKPIAVTLGSTKIIADNATNSIIVIGNEEVKSKVFALIDELDVRPPQVMLHTIIGELTLGENETFGVDYILRKGGQLSTGTSGNGNGNGDDGDNGNGNGNGNGTTTGGIIGFNGSQPILNLNSLLNQRTITQIATAGAGGLSGFITAGNTMTAIVTALEGTRRFRVTQRPSVFAQNNQVASIISGQEIAVPGNIQSSLNSFNQSSGIVTNSTVQYKTVALKLEILPLINSEREVSLDIVQRVDEVSGSTRIDQNDIPTVATRAIKTHVSVPNQATLVLGGLIRQSQTNSRSGIPYLSRLPLIGPLFRTTTKDKSRTELVILIRPEVTMTPCESVDTKERQMEYMNVDPDLETTLVPPNVRKRGTPEDMLRRSQMMLRQDPECIDERTVTGFSKDK